MSEGSNKIFETYIAIDQWPLILKVSLKYKESKWLRWIDIFNLKWYRRYYLKVFYKNGTVKSIPISTHDKEALKTNIMFYNFYLGAM